MIRFPILVARIVLACIVAAAPVPAARAEQAQCPPPKKKRQEPPPDCSKCSDLPMLYRELLEHEFLRNQFDSWIRQRYYPATVDIMQTLAANYLGTAMQGQLYGVLAPNTAGGQGGNAAPAYGTDLTSKSCGLVEYFRCRKGGKDDEVVEVQAPVTPEEVRAKHCKPIADALLAHEGHHQKTCGSSWNQNGSDKFVTVEYVANDDREAYQVGIGVLRQYIAQLARDCGWSGSTNARRPEGTMTVPTPDQIVTLQNNVKSKTEQLKRQSRPRTSARSKS